MSREKPVTVFKRLERDMEFIVRLDDRRAFDHVGEDLDDWAWSNLGKQRKIVEDVA